MAAIRFSEEFANRYGDPHPSFFPGSLDDAIRESCNQPASNVIILFYSKLPFDLTLVGCEVWSARFVLRIVNKDEYFKR